MRIFAGDAKRRDHFKLKSFRRLGAGGLCEEPHGPSKNSKGGGNLGHGLKEVFQKLEIEFKKARALGPTVVTKPQVEIEGRDQRRRLLSEWP